MATLTLDRRKDGTVRGFVARSRYPERHALKAAGGLWDPDKRVWRLPLHADLHLLKRELAELDCDDACYEFLSGWLARRKAVSEVKRAQDADIRCGQGLDPYQRIGVRFLVEAGRAILADDVGLGKTAQAIRAAVEAGAGKVLVVTRKSLVPQWQREVQRWAGVHAAVLASEDRAVPAPGGWLLTHYEAARKHLNGLVTHGPWDALIVDEAHYVKNRTADRSKAVAALAKVARHLWLLTATPIYNRPDDLWHLLHLCDPASFPSWSEFVRQFCLWDELTMQVVGLKDEGHLRRVIDPYLLRRDKSLLNLPPLTEEVRWVRLEGAQARIYRQMALAACAALGDGTVLSAPAVVAQITRLRQIACDPALIGGSGSSAKTTALLELLEGVAEDRKILVFSTFRQYIERLVAVLKEYRPAIVTGAQSGRERDRSVARFREDPACRVLLGTPGALGEGLNLTEAEVVVWLDLDWVPSAHEQGVGRAHRRGQERPVHVVYLLAEGTVDEHVLAVLEDKRIARDSMLAVSEIARRLREQFDGEA